MVEILGEKKKIILDLNGSSKVTYPVPLLGNRESAGNWLTKGEEQSNTAV